MTGDQGPAGDHAAAAMHCRSPVTYEQPWVSDGVWLAHESLPVFGAFAKQFPHDGLWALCVNGVQAVEAPARAVSLQQMITGWAADSVPCVVAPDNYRHSDTVAEAFGQAGLQTLTVIIDDRCVVAFDFDYINAATRGLAGWSMRAALNGIASSSQGNHIGLIFDAEQRVQFAVAPLGTQEDPDQ